MASFSEHFLDLHMPRHSSWVLESMTSFSDSVSCWKMTFGRVDFSTWYIHDLNNVTSPSCSKSWVKNYICLLIQRCAHLYLSIVTKNPETLPSVQVFVPMDVHMHGACVHAGLYAYLFMCVCGLRSMLVTILHHFSPYSSEARSLNQTQSSSIGLISPASLFLGFPVPTFWGRNYKQAFTLTSHLCGSWG